MISAQKIVIGKPFGVERYVENDFVELWEENGIVYGKYKPGVSLDLDGAKKVVEDRTIVFNKVTKPLFIDFTNLINVDTKAREYLSHKNNIQYISAGAFLLGNILNRLVFSVFAKINQPAFPTKAFTDKSSAIEWLEFFKNHN